MCPQGTGTATGYPGRERGRVDRARRENRSRRRNPGGATSLLSAKDGPLIAVPPPAMPGGTSCPRARTPSSPHRSRAPPAPVEQGLVARPARPERAPPPRGPRRPTRGRLPLRRRLRRGRRRRAEARPRRGHAHLAGLVARRLRPLRPAVHPDGVARGRHLPHRRRSRWRRRRPAALRPAQQLARQRQPRQGPPAAVADQAEARRRRVVGRPDRARRQRRPRVHGLRDLRVRLRSPRRLRARRDRLGTGGHLARRRALQRRPRARRPARCGADGSDLREPGGSQRQPRPGRLGPRHP